MEKDTLIEDITFLYGTRAVKLKVFKNLEDAKKGDIIARIEREEDRPQKKVGGGGYAKG